MPTPPSPMSKHRTALRPVGVPLERRIGGQTGAHQRSRQNPATAVRNRGDSADEGRGRGWQIRHRPRCRDDDDWSTGSLLPRRTPGTGTAPDPWINRHAMADGHVLGLRAGAFDDSGDLVPEREWQRAACGHVELFVPTQREVAVLQMQVGMAYAATLDAHQHFAAARRGAVHDRLAERLAVGNERLAMHFSHWDPPSASGVGIMPEAVVCGEGPRQRGKSGNRDVFGARCRV